MDPNQLCKKSRRLRGKMADICNKSALIKQITEGIIRGQKECEYQFRHRRWNCTSAKRSIKKVLLRDTRETGFVNAIVAAGVAYQVTRACTEGDLLGCSCDKKLKYKKNKKKYRGQMMPEGDWEWEGCGSENIDFGIKKSKHYLDTQTKYRKRSDMKTLVKLHNYVAGRLAIKNYMRTECKCHGLSGSCALKTCWRKMPNFREVGNRLKERFDGAAKVIAGNDGQSFMPGDKTIKQPGKTDLVYSEESPNFCEPNNTLGSFGTQGRVCNATSEGEEGCGIMCCNRGYNSFTVSEVQNCGCIFVWCCEVKCEKCNVTQRYSSCT